MKIQDLTVLLVEPSATQAKIVRQQLQALGVTRIETVTSGAAELPVVQARDLHLVVSRLYLPDMSGADLSKTINALDRPFRPAFMLISSETNEAYLEPLRQAGAAAIVRKPFDASFMQEALHAVLDHLEPGTLHLGERDIEEIRVLLADDSTAVRRFLVQLLRGLGIDRIDEADDGATAMPFIDQHYYDLLITDLHMPLLNGIELTRYVRCESQQRSLPIVMITSEADGGRLDMARAAGVSAFLHKPFEAKALKAHIERLLAG